MKHGIDPPPGDSGLATRYRFDAIVVDVAAHTVLRDGQLQALEPKAFAVLLALLARPGALLGRDELIDQVWGHRHVTPGVLTRAIAQLRATLQDDPQHPRYIQTQHALGYRFIGELEPEVQAGSDVDAGLQDAAAATVPDAEAGGPPVDDAGADTGSGAVAGADAGVGAQASASAVAGAAEVPHTASLRPATGVQAPTGPATPLRGAWRWAWLAGLLVALALGIVAWLQRGPGVVEAGPSVAVLPFSALSDDRQDGYLAEGLSLEMLHALAGIPNLKVAAWRPPEAVDRSLDVREQGRLLGVSALLDASLRRQGTRLHVNARLSDTRSGYTLWSHNYEVTEDGLSTVQGDIAEAVAGALVQARPEERIALRKRLAPTESAIAFQAYLLGLGRLLHAQDDESRREATEQFRKALAADAGFARAQAGLCRMALWDFQSNHNAAAFEDARLACLRARNMDQTLGEVNLALGDLYRVQGDAGQAMKYYDLVIDLPALRWQALVGRAQLRIDQGEEALAMRDFQLALQDSPGNAQVLAELGYQQYRLGRYQEAIGSYRSVVALRPDSSEYWGILGALLQLAGQDVQSEEALRRSLALEPNESALSNLGTALYRKGDYAGAADMYRQATTLNPNDFYYLGNLGDALEAEPATAAQAREPYARAAEMAQRFVDASPGEARALAALGWYRAQLGEREQSLQLLQQARALGSQTGEVALFQAQALAVLGLREQARQALQVARQAGVPESRIASSAVFARTGLAVPPDPPVPAEKSPTPATTPTGG